MTDNIEVVLFDLDGTIIDTEPYHYQCWNSILNTHGFDISYEHYLASYAGVAIDNNCRQLIDRYQLKATMAELRAQKEEKMVEFLLNNSLQPMTYVRDLIGLLQGQQIRLGLVTSSSSEETGIILRGLALEDIFEYIVTRDDVMNKKPHPEPYVAAKNFFGLSVDKYIVLEDSLPGIESAKMAGIKCFAIREGLPQNSAYHLAADGVFKDLGQLANALFYPEFRVS